MVSLFKKILELVEGRDRVWLYGIAGLTALNALVEVVGVASIVPFLSVAANPEIVQSSPYLRWVNQALGYSDVDEFLFALGLLVFAVVVGRNFFSATFFWLRARFAARLRHLLGTGLMVKYLRQPYTAFLNRNSSELTRNILAEANHASNLLRACLELLAQGLATVSILVLLVASDPWLALVVTAVLGLAYSTVWTFARKWVSVIGQERLAANKQRFGVSAEAFGSIKETKLLRTESYFENAFAEPDRLFLRHEATNTLIAALPRFVLEAIAFGGILLIVLYLIATHDDFQQVVPTVGLYAFAGYRLLPALQGVLGSAALIRFNMPSFDQVYQDFLEEGRASVPKPGKTHATSRKKPELEFLEQFELRNVTFTYPEAASPAVHTVELTVPKNSSIGLVGATGSGKTTTMDLILGLLRPQEGHLVVDGQRVSDEQLWAWQAKLGYVPQDVYLSDDTIRHNIAFAVPEEQIDDEAVRRAARIANIANFIEEELPQGYETIVGERGVRVSGGQKQRIGIARALYRDPEVLVFDEATSALDSATEKAIIEAVERLSVEKTIIQIAHRITTVRNCDRIYLLERGRIVAHGSYSELLQSSATFQQLAKVPAQTGGQPGSPNAR